VPSVGVFDIRGKYLMKFEYVFYHNSDTAKGIIRHTIYLPLILNGSYMVAVFKKRQEMHHLLQKH
jgi:hypothetical protein